MLKKNIIHGEETGKAVGVMIFVREDILVEEAECDGGMAETMSVVVNIREGEGRKIIVTFIPPKSNTYKINKYKRIQQETRTSMYRRNDKM